MQLGLRGHRGPILDTKFVKKDSSRDSTDVGSNSRGFIDQWQAEWGGLGLPAWDFGVCRRRIFSDQKPVYTSVLSLRSTKRPRNCSTSWLSAFGLAIGLWVI